MSGSSNTNRPRASVHIHPEFAGWITKNISNHAGHIQELYQRTEALDREMAATDRLMKRVERLERDAPKGPSLLLLGAIGLSFVSFALHLVAAVSRGL